MCYQHASATDPAAGHTAADSTTDLAPHNRSHEGSRRMRPPNRIRHHRRTANACQIHLSSNSLPGTPRADYPARMRQPSSLEHHAADSHPTPERSKSGALLLPADMQMRTASTRASSNRLPNAACQHNCWRRMHTYRYHERMLLVRLRGCAHTAALRRLVSCARILSSTATNGALASESRRES